MTPYQRSTRIDRRAMRRWCMGVALVLAAVALGWLWLLYVAVLAAVSAVRV